MGQTVIEWTNLAKVRLQEIFDYYNTVAGLTTANRIIEKITRRTYLLMQHQQLGPRLFTEGEFRYLVEGNYKIIYWLVPGKVMIATVFDTRQDPEKLQKEISDL